MSTIQQIVRGDCMKVPAPDYDILYTDPPYSKRVHWDATSHSPKGDKLRVRHRDMGFTYLKPELRRYIASLAAGAKRWALIHCDLESVAWWKISLEAAGATYVRSIPWVRWSMPQLSGDRPPQGAEMVILAAGKRYRGRKSWNGPGNLTHLAHKCLRGESKHKAEKPLDQALDLVSWFSNPGEVVYDPLAGSGTAGLACRILGRGFCGVELNDGWAQRAWARINEKGLSDRDEERYNRWKESRCPKPK